MIDYKIYLRWIINIGSIVALLFYFRWGGVRSLTGLVIGAIIATMLLTTNKGRTALAVIDSTTKQPIWRFK
jgi:hypothetical protein